jgi:hypothetical protein
MSDLSSISQFEMVHGVLMQDEQLENLGID